METFNYKKKRTWTERLHLNHKINLRSGLYWFLGQNIIKLIIALVIIVLAIYLIDWIFDLKKQQEYIQAIVDQMEPVYVFIFFLATESFMGLIPPDIFIVWGKARFPDSAYLLVAILASLSYIGGIIAYKLGSWSLKFPRVKNFIARKYEKNFDLIKKWGGLVIIVAALFPLPFAMTSTAAGIVKYPFKQFLLFGLTRYIRFFLYAIVIFGVLKDFL